MKRTSVSTKAVDLFGSGKHGFTDGIVSPDVTPGTVLESTVMNAHQEEIARAIEANGTVLRAAGYDQLARVECFRHALHALLNDGSVIDTGTAFAMNGAACNDTGRVIFVGESGAIYSLDEFDPASFVSQTAAGAYAGNFMDVIWTGSLFVATGTNGEVQTSPDGVTWTSRVTSGGVAGTNNVGRIAMNGSGLLVACVAPGTLDTITSTNGTTWSAGATISNIVATRIACDRNSGVWVLAGGSGNTHACARSTDGLTWTVLDLSAVLATLDTFSDVAAADAGGFVAYISNNVGVKKIAVSDDGLAWTVDGALNSTTVNHALSAERGGYALLPLTAPDKGAVSGDGWTFTARRFAGVRIVCSRLVQLNMQGTRCWTTLGKDADAGKMTISSLWGY